MDWTLWHYAAVAALGVAAGIINILAGGGSNLILPVLMIFGVPPDVANGTNRVGVLFQSLAGIRGFRRAGRLPTQDWKGVMLPLVAGGLAGSVLASVLPNAVLKPALLLTMLGVAALILVKPSLLLAADGTAVRTVAATPWARPVLFAAGIYGGFVQAGAGFLLLPIFAGLLCYDLVRANALKVLCTLSFTAVSLAVFLWYGKIWWGVGLVLAAGNTLGAEIGVRLALKLSPAVMRWLLFVMTLAAVAGAMWQ
ncbi:sulfite exporter TauE/SafE family protein [Neisseria leonii]|uniref:Probable membrane transporter protein n=1 Tax=Neisseria leonii TaxID=2995413 RepID=A0A9X4ID94_9NEIS|nr:sulfite exporter TauE/SafE family protein [Neisseria sp. 51.81]MDD9327461.1 sulfite exporter TauE/SafE family protein [Neisseria sp. 51.81]